MEIRQLKEKWEAEHLGQNAALSQNSQGRVYGDNPCPIRTCYERDKGRILYSMAFRRLRQKTQVFFNPRNDHVCTRMEHVLMVNYVARIIGSALSLNGDLIEAISLGHDLGHTPFGHSGERALRILMESKGNGLSFHHEQHSLRVVDLLSERGAKRGLNLTFEVRDGIVCHCGEQYRERRLVPDRTKTESDLLNSGSKHSMPATLEGCVVRIADRIAYVGRDIEDAARAGLMEFADLPEKVKLHLGKTNAEIVNTLVTDIITISQGHDRIEMSSECGELLAQLLEANMQHIYKSNKLKRFENQVQNVIEGLFEAFYNATLGNDNLENHSDVTLQTFGKWLLRHPSKDDSHLQKTVDYIAGMTDHYATQAYESLYLV